MSNLPETPRKTRMGSRLKALFDQIPNNTSEVFDLCCDHGAIGRAVLESHLSTKVTFNDIHPGIMSELAQTLERLNAVNYQLNVGPAEKLEITPSARPVFLLAGVGDEQAINILAWLFDHPDTNNALFIISPATKTYFVRKFLQIKNKNISIDKAVTDNKRTYEIIVVDENDQTNISIQKSLFGDCWEIENSDHISHIQKLIGYYGAKIVNDHRQYEAITQGYKNILKKIKLNP